jgi:hypothetical protein
MDAKNVLNEKGMDEKKADDLHDRIGVGNVY